MLQEVGYDVVPQARRGGSRATGAPLGGRRDASAWVKKKQGIDRSFLGFWCVFVENKKLCSLEKSWSLRSGCFFLHMFFFLGLVTKRPEASDQIF